MCTVSFIPTGDSRFILTSNRDEAPERAAEEVVVSPMKGLIYPKDKGAGGTWLCASTYGRVVCLLNGAGEMHVRTPPYRKSRGIVVLDTFKYAKPTNFLESYDLGCIEPFTLVWWEKGSLFDFKWDGLEKKMLEKDPTQPHIWSSSTLYPKEVRERRESWFREWLESHSSFDLESVRQFHTKAGEDDPHNALVMNRNDVVRTVSISSVVNVDKKLALLHLNLLTNKLSMKHIPKKLF